MSEPKRVSPTTVRERQQQGSETLLVCAYDDEDKCRSKLLEGAVTLQDLQERLPRMEKDRNLVFYCA